MMQVDTYASHDHTRSTIYSKRIQSSQAKVLESLLLSADESFLRELSSLDLNLMIRELSPRSFKVFVKKVYDNPRLLYLMQDLFREISNANQSYFSSVLSQFPAVSLLPHVLDLNTVAQMRNKIEGAKKFKRIRNSRPRYFVDYYSVHVDLVGNFTVARRSPRLGAQNDFDISPHMPQIFEKFLTQMHDFGESILNARIVFRAYLVRSSPYRVTQSFDWHRDVMGEHGFAHYTMVILLADPHDPHHGWKGGEFLCQKNEACNHKTPVTDRPTVVLYPQLNQGIFFANYDTVHKVTQILGNGIGIPKRDILIINAIKYNRF